MTFTKTILVPLLMAPVMLACAAETPDDEVESSADALTCDQQQLAVCQQHGGGKACVSKWCTGSTAQSGAAKQPAGTNAGARLASLARRRDGYPSGGRCYEYVYYAIRDANITSQAVLDQYGVGYGGAWDFARFGESSPAGMARVGFERSTVSPSDAPLGSILVWRPGQCGYSARYGHIEVVVGGDRACSDFCAPIAKGCGAPVVYVPMR